MNKGDTIKLILDYTINDEPLIEDAYDDIELQLNSHDQKNSIQLLLSERRIEWDAAINKYAAILTQEDTFKLANKNLNQNDDVFYQLRIYSDDKVISTSIGSFPIGKVLSDYVFGEDEDETETL